MSPQRTIQGVSVMSQTIVIVGAVALGPKAACRFKRLEPGSRVIMIDQGSMISYGGCGIPYYISGDVSDPDELQSTSFHMVRDARFFKEAKGIEVMTETRATAIDREGKLLRVIDLKTGKEGGIAYDQLVLATGSRPRRLPIPGAELEGVFTVSSLDEAVRIKARIAEGQVGKAVVIGAGAIGLEMAEAMSDLWGIETTVVEVQDQILPHIVSPTLARMAQRHMEESGVAFQMGEEVRRIEGEGCVERVLTGQGALEADLVVMAVGVTPNVDLAREAGLAVSERGAIMVNTRMQTSDPSIYAGGDCVEIPNLITGKPGYWPLGSLANRQGRVVGTNLAGGRAEFEGAVGSFVVKLFDMSVASSGLSLSVARREGFDAVSTFVVQFDRAHFYPEKDLLYLELVVEKGTRRVLGIQGIGNKGDGLLARISAVAAILKHRPTTADVSNMELPYSPPFSSAMDVLNALGNAAENLLDGKNRVMDVDQFDEWWNHRENGKTFFMDCRNWGNAEAYVKKYPEHWKSIPQDELRNRLSEVPQDKNIVLICNTGVRSYEAQVFLDEMGFHNTFNLQGGMAAVKKWPGDL